MSANRPLRIHCSYHKCLTVYFARVLGGLCNRTLPWRGRFRHYNSDLHAFLGGFSGDRVSSVNNRVLDLHDLADAVGGRALRVTRFLRDPRDLVVSGYWYHRRGAEPWTLIENPTAEQWEFANGVVPAGLERAGGSFAAYLQGAAQEEGVLAELEFRKRHFDSMAQWPEDPERVLLLRYEEVLADPVAAFDRIFRWYELSPFERRLGRWWARRHALKPRQPRSGSDPHVRDPRPGQWRQLFTEPVQRAFEEQHPGLLEQLGYADR